MPLVRYAVNVPWFSVLAAAPMVAPYTCVDVTLLEVSGGTKSEAREMSAKIGDE